MGQREWNQTYYRKHREKYIEYSRRYRAARPGWASLTERARKYGLTLAQVQELLNRTTTCESCSSVLAHHKRGAVHIDHDHQTGKVRGVLCRACNVSLGYFKEDATRIQALAKYITLHRGDTSGV